MKAILPMNDRAVGREPHRGAVSQQAICYASFSYAGQDLGGNTLQFINFSGTGACHLTRSNRD